MLNFLKYTLATIVGVFIASFFMFLIFMALVGSIVSMQEKPGQALPNSILRMNLNYVITDRTSKNPFNTFDYINMRFVSRPGLNDILSNIQKAKNDDNILGIYLEPGMIAAGKATIEEIRNALIDFKESGKFLVSYGDIYTHSSVYLASVADKIYMNPTGIIEFVGLRTEIMFYKGALEKIGVEAQIVRHGKFKSYVEPYTLDKMSDENREQRMKYMNAIWSHMLEGISEKRNISVDQLNLLADNITIDCPKAAVENNLIDELKFEDEVKDELKKLSGFSANRKVRFVSMNEYSRVPVKKSNKGFTRNKIAVVFATGSIEMGDGTDQSIGASRIAGAIQKARTDTTIKAIVIRINSGGGGMIPSEIIWREVDLARQEKPVIASMGDLAASGGYYILTPADTIVANPTTITGSIGVFGIIPNAQKLLNEKLGITIDVAKTNKNADIGSFYRPLTKTERKYLEDNVERSYDLFLSHVSEGRNMTKEQVDEIGQGRVWSGVDAKNIGLVDILGGLELAIKIAAEKAKLDNYRLVALPRQIDPYQQILSDLTGSIKSSILEKELGESYRYYKNLHEILKIEGVQARIPYSLEIY